MRRTNKATPPAPLTTHYLPAFTQSRGRVGSAHYEEKTACGIWIQEDQFSCEPTCTECQAWLEEDAKALASLDEIEGDVVTVDYDRDITGGRAREVRR